VTEADARAFLALERKEQETERTVWAVEMNAQRHEDVFLALWDTLNHALEPLTVLAEFSFEELRIGGTNSVQELQHGIRRITFRDAAPETPTKHLDTAEWRRSLEAWRAEGCSWAVRAGGRRFTPPHRSARWSVMGASAQLINESRGNAVLRGDPSQGNPMAIPAVPVHGSSLRDDSNCWCAAHHRSRKLHCRADADGELYFADPLLLHDFVATDIRKS
jgi:hypothetical protein